MRKKICSELCCRRRFLWSSLRARWISLCLTPSGSDVNVAYDKRCKALCCTAASLQPRHLRRFLHLPPPENRRALRQLTQVPEQGLVLLPHHTVRNRHVSSELVGFTRPGRALQERRGGHVGGEPVEIDERVAPDVGVAGEAGELVSVDFGGRRTGGDGR